MKQAVESAEVLVRINPMHEAAGEYCSSQQEIDDVIRACADIIMLPYISVNLKNSTESVYRER